MPSLAPELLQRFTTALFIATNTPPKDAEAVAAHLVDANRCGHDSHGVIRAPGYLQAIADGRTIPGADIQSQRDDGVTVTIDGGWNFGQLVATRAMKLACERASEHGVAIVVAYRSAHVGRLGAYVEQAADTGLIGIIMANNHGASARVAPFGGTRARLATDPMAFGLPTDDPTAPMVIDIATSVVAEGKVRVARNAGRTVPDGWILDAEGQPSNEPAALYSDPPGALLPLGGNAGHKGFGLALVVEALAGALSPAGTTRPKPEHGGNSLFVMAIEPQRFVGRRAFVTSLGDLTHEVKRPPFREGTSEVLLPGELERRIRRERTNAIPLDDDTWAQLKRVAAVHSVALPKIAD